LLKLSLQPDYSAYREQHSRAHHSFICLSKAGQRVMARDSFSSVHRKYCTHDAFDGFVIVMTALLPPTMKAMMPLKVPLLTCRQKSGHMGSAHALKESQRLHAEGIKVHSHPPSFPFPPSAPRRRRSL
jgi:hypothetical protein